MPQLMTPPTSLFTPLSDDISQSVTLIENAQNWQEKYRQIMLLGKKLPMLAPEFQCEAAQVKGCESQAWLYHQQIGEQHFYVASSDARIVKGLIALVLSAVQGQTREQIIAFDMHEYFSNLGLSGQLSPSRTNGISAMTQAIQAYCQTN